jgi:hypothetical protein
MTEPPMLSSNSIVSAGLTKNKFEMNQTNTIYLIAKS